MNAIIQKLEELTKLNYTLPISKQEVTVNKINLELQSQFEDFARNVKNELTSSTKYLQFINNHIKKESKNNIGYLDKLYILQQWYNDVKEEKIDCEITELSIPEYTITIDDVDLKFVFELPEIAKELALLKYIINTYKDEMKSVDALFYFIFRFVRSINIDEDTLNVEDIETAEILYKHLSMSKITNITQHIDKALDSIQPLRNFEIDPRVFFA
tara:strand:+ start:1452 stop:2093 length:642 start_codon:yes stop_codon:yes gene_type:complete